MFVTLVRQQDETDCGAACLATIAKFYGKRISIHRIRGLAGTDTKGTSGKGIVKAACELGFSCKAFVSKEKNLKVNLPCPLIAHIVRNEIEHYVVIYKIKNNKILIADPADRILWLKTDDFKKDWSGIFFLIQPENKFDEIAESKSFFGRFMYLLSRDKSMAASIFVGSLALTALGIMGAFYFRYLIDDVIYSEARGTLTAISVAYFIMLVFQGLLNFCRNQLVNSLGNKIEASLIQDYFGHLLKLPVDFFMKHKSGEILSRFNDVNIIKNALSSMTIGIILDSFMIVFGGIVLAKFGGSLLGVAVIPVVLSSALVLLCVRKFKEMILKRAVLEAERYSLFVESINGIATIKALGAEKDIYEKAEMKILKAIDSGYKLHAFGNLQGTFETFFSQAGNLMIYWLGSILIMNGRLSLGELISFVTLLGYFLSPLSRLISLQPQLQELSVSAKRLGEILELPEETADENSASDMNFTKAEISIRNMNFSYGTRGATLKNISLDIHEGESVAFVGPSGSGKTTLVKLLLKFYKPESGEIMIDGTNINDIKTSTYRSWFGYVPQDVLLFSDSIAENIAFGMDGIDRKAVFEAARDAEALDFVSKLELRLDTKVGERGATLSGGERQRISLARILIRKPKILVLDEATSSLDTMSEAAVMKTINNIGKKTTTIIVAHRLSTIKNCDRIFVLKDGELVESGNHSQLLLSDGIYANMWKSQSGNDEFCEPKKSEELNKPKRKPAASKSRARLILKNSSEELKESV